MNYYDRHIGDYVRDTAHLTMLEHGAYTLLLDRYYATEKPIPADKAHRVTRARTKEERAAVDAVLEEFFVLEQDGWHSGRCDSVIEDYQAGEPDREAKRSNATERQRRARERRAAMYQELASHGIHPDWNAPMETLKRLLSGVTSQPVTPPVTRDATATNTHTPDPIKNTHTPHDDRLDIPGLVDHHAVVWQPDADRLAAELQRAGVPMPDAESLARSLRRFNAHHEGKALTDNQRYTYLTDWLEGDHRRDQNRPAPRVGPVAGDQAATRKLTPLEQVRAARDRALRGA